jgi:hypothetical protein
MYWAVGPGCVLLSRASLSPIGTRRAFSTPIGGSSRSTECMTEHTTPRSTSSGDVGREADFTPAGYRAVGCSAGKGGECCSIKSVPCLCFHAPARFVPHLSPAPRSFLRTTFRCSSALAAATQYIHPPPTLLWLSNDTRLLARPRCVELATWYVYATQQRQLRMV